MPPHPWSLPPADLRHQQGLFVAAIGVGTVHRDEPQPGREVAPPVRAIHARLKALFDPTGRLAPGRDVLAA
jgi:hypothetical protein